MKKLLTIVACVSFLMLASEASAQSETVSDTIPHKQEPKKKKGKKDKDDSPPAGIIIDERGTGKGKPKGGSSAKSGNTENRSTDEGGIIIDERGTGKGKPKGGNSAKSGNTEGSSGSKEETPDPKAP